MAVHMPSGEGLCMLRGIRHQHCLVPMAGWQHAHHLRRAAAKGRLNHQRPVLDDHGPHGVAQPAVQGGQAAATVRQAGSVHFYAGLAHIWERVERGRRLGLLLKPDPISARISPQRFFHDDAQLLVRQSALLECPLPLDASSCTHAACPQTCIPVAPTPLNLTTLAKLH